MIQTQYFTGLSYRNGQVAVSPTFVIATLQNYDCRPLPDQNYHRIGGPISFNFLKTPPNSTNETIGANRSAGADTRWL